MDKEFLKNITILYAEDDAKIRDEFASLLKKILKEVITAEDGVQALEKYEENKNEIDLVISDINMPNVNGIELLDEIKSQNPKVPFIFTTAYTDSEYLVKAIKHKVSDYFVKPTNIRDIIKKIEHICKSKINENKISQVESKTKKYLNIINQVAIVYIFDEKGKLVYVNEFLEELTQCSKEELIDKNYQSLFHPDMAKDVLHKQWDDLNEKKETWKGKIKYISKENSIFYGNAIIIPSTHNNITRYTSINFLTTKEENTRREYKKKVLYNFQETKKIFRVAQEKIKILNKTLAQYKGYDKKAQDLQDLKLKNNKNFTELQNKEEKIRSIKDRLNQLTYGVNSKIQKIAIATADMKDEEEKSSKKIDKTIQEIKMREQFIEKIKLEIHEKTTTIKDLEDVLEHRNEQLEG
jgi:PAS domain S-box-containing protein